MTIYLRLAILAVAMTLLVGIGWKIHHSGVQSGRAEVRAEWTAQIARQMQAAMDESQANAKETLRRLERQQENQDAQDKLLATARRDAERNAADADRLRTQSADAARQWRDALGDSPAAGVCQAAGAAIAMQADVLGRMDRAATELTRHADAARTAGLKCEADYQALTTGR